MTDNAISYITVDELKATDIHTEQDRDDAILVDMCLQASRDFETFAAGTLFYPQFVTRYYNEPHDLYRLPTHDDWLQITSLKTNVESTSVTVTLSNVQLSSGDDYNLLPANILNLKRHQSNTFLSIYARSIEVIGYSGFVPHWSDGAWVDTGLTVSAVTSTTYTLDTIPGADFRGGKPALGWLSMVRLVDSSGDYEYAIVTDEITDSAIDVQRGVAGTSSITPTLSQSLEVFRPNDTVVKAVRRLAAFYFRQKDTSRPDQERPIITTGGVVLPADIPKDVLRVAKSFVGATS